jgi:hypothetical protein
MRRIKNSWAAVIAPTVTGWAVRKLAVSRLRPGVTRRSVVVAVVAFMPLMTAAGSQSGWRTVTTVNPAALNGQLFGEACAAAGSCTAVGAYTTAAGVVHPLAERWNGHVWRIERPPTQVGARLGQLYAVACGAASSCTAVGRFVNAAGVSHVLVERLVGGDWRVQQAPDPAGSPWSELSSVTCPSGEECLAVGDSINAAGTDLAISERWNGARWSLVVTPNPRGAQFAFLNSLVCPGRDLCVAVGGSDSGPLVERWNGRAWHLVTAPSPPGAQGAFLLAVACPSVSSCTAVGGSSLGNLAERWNGRSWHPEPVPGPAGAQFAVLEGISCITSPDCVAVGGYQPATGQFLTEAARRTSQGWNFEQTPNPAGTSGNNLQAVVCSFRSACTAVGAANGNGTPTVLGEHWNGRSWSLRPMPSPRGVAETQLNAVACPSVSRCLSVGTAGPTSGVTSAVAERWNGTSWERQRIPSPPGADLQAIACVSSAFCAAAGGDAAGTLAERWDGHRWNVAATPNPVHARGAGFGGVSCTSRSFCMAAGAYCVSSMAACDQGGGTVLALTERWNGRTWQILHTPTPPGTVQTFIGPISCTSPAACTTTGETHYPSGTVRTIAERWNGARWRIQPTPNPAHVSFASLGAVACPGPSSCLAVGSSDNGNLAERWNGTSWRIVPIPTPPGSGGLFSLSCATASACTAVGVAFNLQGGYLLAERWNGTRWSIQPTPLFAGAQDINAAVTCPTRLVCMAVGGQESPRPTRVTFAEVWNGSSEPASGAMPPFATSPRPQTTCASTSLRSSPLGGRPLRSSYDSAEAHGLDWLPAHRAC